MFVSFVIHTHTFFKLVRGFPDVRLFLTELFLYSLELGIYLKVVVVLEFVGFASKFVFCAAQFSMYFVRNAFMLLDNFLLQSVEFVIEIICHITFL